MIFSRNEKLVLCFLCAAIILSVFILGSNIFDILDPEILNENEQFNAYFTQRVINHWPLYTTFDLDDTMLNNYPPLSFYLYGFLHQLPFFKQIDLVIFGRFLTTFACIASGILVAFLSFKTAVSVKIATPFMAGLVSFLLFCLLNTTLVYKYFVVYDPQWTGELFLLAGLSIFVSLEGLPALALTSLFFILAGLVKHNLIAAPLAVAIYLYLKNIRGFYFYLLISTLFLSIALYGMWFFCGPECFENILGIELYARKTTFLRAFTHSLTTYPVLLIFLYFAFQFCKKRSFTDPQYNLYSFWIVMGVVSYSIGFYGRCKSGCNVNVYFDFFLVTCILFGCLITARLKSPLKAISPCR